MALLNTGCLISTIQTDVTGITTGYAADCFTVIAAGVDGATQDRCVTVPTSGSLPSLWPTQTVPQGQVVFVDDVGVPVIAASGKWIGFDQRTFRYDAPQGLISTWGCNADGQLGNGSTTSRSSPGGICGAGSTWLSISASCTFTSAIKTDGTLWTWGANGYRTLGDGSATARSSPGTTAGGGTNWRQVSSGARHAAGIKIDGTLWTWGTNTSGELGNGTTTLGSSPATTAGGGTNWCLVSAGRNFTIGLKTDGTIWTWGANASGQLGDNTTTSRSSPGTVAGGGNTWCFAVAGCSNVGAIKTDGTLWTWGANGFGNLGDGSFTNRSSPGTTSGAGTTWKSISMECLHSVGIKTDGTLWVWGGNTCGALGDGTTSIRTSPVTTAGGGTNWCVGVAGCLYSAAIKTDGTLWTWGHNSNGKLGDGTTTNRCSPGTVSGGGTTWFTVSAGYEHAGAIKTS